MLSTTPVGRPLTTSAGGVDWAVMLAPAAGHEPGASWSDWEALAWAPGERRSPHTSRAQIASRYNPMESRSGRRGIVPRPPLTDCGAWRAWQRRNGLEIGRASSEMNEASFARWKPEAYERWIALPGAWLVARERLISPGGRRSDGRALAEAAAHRSTSEFESASPRIQRGRGHPCAGGASFKVGVFTGYFRARPLICPYSCALQACLHRKLGTQERGCRTRELSRKIQVAMLANARACVSGSFPDGQGLCRGRRSLKCVGHF